jgi:hypothetical protein
MKYRGMLEACKQQLDWSVERYANLPQPPLLLEVRHVPYKKLIENAIAAVAWLYFIPFIIGGVVVHGVISAFFEFIRSAGGPYAHAGEASVKSLDSFLPFVMWGGFVCFLLVGIVPCVRATIANGTRPAENSRRQHAYEEARAMALRAAEAIKAAEDHRLRCQIRELEGLAKTVGEKEADVRRILATL